MAEKAALKGNFKDVTSIYSDLFKGLAKGKTESGRVLRTGRGTRFDALGARGITDRGTGFIKLFTNEKWQIK